MNPSPHNEVPVTAADFAVATPLPVEGEPAQPKAQRHVSLWDYPATYSLIGVNVIIFALMVWSGHLWQHISGANFAMAEFDPDTLLRFGGSYSVFVLQGQWWRLLTATFVHVSLLHIGLNMWCLWNLGVFGEPLLGRRGLVLVYMLTGIAGNMLSLGWAVLTNSQALVAGASGAVFGIAGILIVLLSNRGLSLPWEELRSLRRQVIFFAVINLAIGMAPQMLMMFSRNMPRIDNTAHIGGFLSGLALGLPLFPRMLSGRQNYRRRQTHTFIAATLLLCLFGYAISAFAK